jgi:5-methylcytosine-specific restriction protein A
MPIAARRPCWKVGCSNYQPCSEHIKPKVDKGWSRRHDLQRPSSSQRGYGWHWQKYTMGFKKRNPFCIDPQRRHPHKAKRTEHVDHIKPVHGLEDPLFWDPSNHQALCASCHGYKTATEDGGFGRIKKQ